MTTQELSQHLAEAQNMSLDAKIAHSLEVISTFMSRTGKEPCVSFSGGKDSTVLLHLVRRLFPDCVGVFCNTTNESPEIINFVRSTDNIEVIRPEMTLKEVVDKYGFPLISKENAHKIREARNTKSEFMRQLRIDGISGRERQRIPEKWQFLLDAPFEVSEQCCDILKKRPLKKYERQTGRVPIIGTMVEESSLRRQKYLRQGGCSSFSGRVASYPLSIWTEADIWEYLRRFNVPYCEIYDDPTVKRTGCVVCGFGAQSNHERFTHLREKYPRFYEQCMNFTNNGISYREALKYIGIEA